MNKVLDWVKSNVVIVVLVVVMIAVLVTLPMYAKGQNAKVREQVESRVQKASELKKLDETAFEDPVTGEQSKIAVNEALLRQYEAVIDSKRRDGEQVLEQALAFNRDGHEIIEPANWSQSMGPWLFPKPSEELKEIRPSQFHDLLVQRYDQLLENINGGSPPDPEALAAELQEKDGQFRLHSLSKTAEEMLDAEDKQKLTEHLQAYRLQRYEETASSVNIYAELEALNVPVWQPSYMPSLAELFQWQWDFWLISDVLYALSDANAGSSSVLLAPVKRLLVIQPTDAPAVSVGGSDGSGGGGGMASGGGMAGGSTKGRRPIPGASGPTAGNNNSGGQMNSAGGQAKAINPNQPVPTNFSVSFTGRQTNHLYDVRYVQLSVIADTERLPMIVDALAARNFITVLDMSISPIDPFEHVRNGFMYGDGTLCQANFVLETVWLRQWTSEKMPDEMRSALGIPAPPATPQPNMNPQG